MRLPKLVYCELTNICPLSCVICPWGNGLIKHQGSMEESIFKKVVDEISLWDQRPSLGLYNMGEFLVHPKCFHFIRYAKSKGLRVFTCSNGILLDHEKSLELIESGLDEIRFSFEGDDPGLYERMRKGSDYKKVLNNIQDFLKLLALHKSKMTVDILVIRYSKEQSLDIKDEFKRLFTSIYDVNFYSYYASNWRNTIKKDFLNIEKKDRPMKAPCYKFENIIIAYDGKILHCDLDYNGDFSDSNIKDITLKEFVFSGKRKDIYKKMEEGRWDEIRPCRDCSAPFTILNRKRYYETKQRKICLDLPLQTIQHESDLNAR